MSSVKRDPLISRLMVLMFTVLVSGCGNPSWSIRLDVKQDVTASAQVSVVDRRTEAEKNFRFDQFWKASYRSYLADSNTTPDRITVLRTRLAESIETESQRLTVLVDKFDILDDFSGTAPGGVAVLPAGSGSMVVPLGSGNGSNVFICSLRATINQREFEAEFHQDFRPNVWTSSTAIRSTAMQGCLDGAINSWITQARPYM